MEKNEKTEKNEVHVTDNDNSLYNFFEKNRRFLLTSIVALAVLLVGIIGALLVRDFMHKDAIAKLDILIERYDGIKGKLADGGAAGNDIETEAGGEIEISESAGDVPESETNAETTDGTEDSDIQVLLDDLEALGKSASGYPAARAWFMAANIRHERREWREAEAAWLEGARKGVSTHLAPVCLYNAAVAAETAGDTDSALSNYQKSLGFADFPAASHAQFSIGRLEETKGDNGAAIAAYRAVIEKWPADTAWTNLAHSRIIALEAGGQ
jgi:tetratricopeptide (TPR) repeat protein